MATLNELPEPGWRLPRQREQGYTLTAAVEIDREIEILHSTSVLVVLLFDVG
jgi:hypothetical protein